MAPWDADTEVEQAYDFRRQASVARNLGQESLATLFEQVARLAMAKAEIFQGLDKLHDHLDGRAAEADAEP
jgi:propanediol dehydratase small subunit